MWSNPRACEFVTMPGSIRFTADNRSQTIYVWDFGQAYHTDISIALGFKDTFGALDFLKGHARRNSHDEYEMVGSDFLESIIRRSCGKDRVYLLKLITQDWSWLSEYVTVGNYLNVLRKHV